MGSADITLMIDRAAKDVFAVLADVSLNARWSSTSVEGRQTSPGPVGLGTTAHEISRFAGRRIEVDSTIVDFEPDRRLGYVTSGGPFPFKGTFEVEPTGGGTRLMATFDASPVGMLRLADRLITMLGKRQLGRDLATLKRLMEADPSWPHQGMHPDAAR